jgi:hypothetical protein
MTELMASVKLNDWLYQNEISTCNFIAFIGHKENESVYGILFQTDKGLLFQRHKWAEVNKNKPTPRVCAEMQYSCKLVTDEIWNSFKKLDNAEYMGRDVMDMQSI